jgi:hypothetical protein
MSGYDSTQREVIQRLSIILHPARATMPAGQNAGGDGERASLSVQDRPPRMNLRAGAMQQRYRLYRVCGYGVVPALYYAARSPSW